MANPIFPQPLLDALAAADPDSVAFEHHTEHGVRTVTRRETLTLIGRYTTGLRAAGAGPGRGVALATAVTPEAFAAQVAAHALGARVIGVRPGLTAAQLPHVVGSDVDLLLVDEITDTAELRAAAGKTPRLRIADLPGDYQEPAAAGHHDDIALLIFTSGSTGWPKGAAFAYAALSAYYPWQPAVWRDDVRDLATKYRRYLLFGTLTSAVITAHLGVCLHSGGTAVIPRTPEFPAVLADLRISACLMTVPRLHDMLDQLRLTDRRFPDLELLLVAGSPLAPHRLTEATQRIGPAVHQAYGQTEVGMMTLLRPADLDRHPHAAHSVGRAWNGMHIDIREPGPDGVGEIWVRTPNAFTGYWRDPAETAEVRVDGWVRTRDLGRLDDDGFLHLAGRARDVIIINAVLHYAGAIERVLAAHPDVDQAYVVAAPDERTGEAAHGFVVPADGALPDLDALRAQVAAELGAASVPATLTVIPAAPIAPGGKPDKSVLLRDFR